MFTKVSRRGSSSWLVVTMLALASLAAVPASAQQEVAPDDTEIRTVMESAAPCLNVRERPSYRAPIVGCVDSGRTVTVTGVSRGWSYVIVDDQLRGWAGSRFLGGGAAPAPAEPEPPADQASSPERISEGEVVRAGEPVAQPDRFEAPVEELSQAADPPEPRRRSRAQAAEVPAEREATGVDVDEFLRVSAERDRVRELLAAATARVEELEAEVAALREQAQRGAEHSGRLAALTTERDDLARQLAQSEAQQIYLQSALEETRSELMQLKGIPPKLVRIEPPPEPEPLPLEEEPEPIVEDAASEPSMPLPSIVSVASMDEVVATVRAWAKAWSEQRADGYLSFYSVDFRPPDGLSREVWAAQRRARIEAPRSIEVTLDRINPIVSGDRATVSFVQSYRSDTFEDVVEKTLVLERTDGLWRIVDEQAR